MGHEIHFQTDVKYLVPGETVRVPIVIELDQPTKIRNITAQFHAAERAEADYTVTSTDSKGASRTETRTAVDHHDIVKQDYLLEGDPPLGCMAGMADAFAAMFGAGRGKTLDTGQHKYIVEFRIPDDAPASLDGRKCRIFYELSVRIDRPLARDPRKTHKFEVASTVERLQGEPVVAYYPDENGRGFWDRTFGRNARLTLALQNDVCTPGDKMIALFQAETDSPIKIKSATARLLCIESSRADGHTDSHTHQTEPVTIAAAQEILGGFSTELVIDAESIGPPSAKAHNFDVKWYIEVTLDVPWAKDPIIRAPVRMVGSE
jgi:hypothetical protein